MAKQDYITAIAHCSALNILPETARGNFILFLIYWINAGCRHVDVSQLQIPIGMKDAVWNRYKIVVKDVAEVIMPELRAIYERKEKERKYFDNYREAQRANKVRNSTFSDSDISQEQNKRPATLSQTTQYKASHAHLMPKGNSSGNIPAGGLRDR